MGYWSNKTVVTSYDQAAALFAKARDPQKGKPVKRWCRLFKHGDTYQLRMDYLDTLIAVFRPDNTLEIVADRKAMRMHSATLTGALHKAIPVMLCRVGVGRYMVASTKAVDAVNDRTICGNQKVRRVGSELFEGIKFDLNTAMDVCINPKPDVTVSLDPEKRKVWLRSLKAFKRGVAVRVKLGVFEPLCNQVASRRAANKTWEKPDWHSEQWTNMLYESIRDQQFSTELLTGFVQTAYVSYWRQEQPTPQKAYSAMESVITDLSVELRRKFGVFGEHNEPQVHSND